MKHYFNSITAFMLSFIIAFTLCFPIFVLKNTKVVKADTLAWERVGIPIFTFFVLAGKSARDQLANDLTQFGKDTAKSAQYWWSKLTSKQQKDIIDKYDSGSYIDVTEYRGLGFEDIPKYSNRVEYTPSSYSQLPSVSSEQISLINNLLKSVSDERQLPVSLTTIKNSYIKDGTCYFLYKLSFGNSFWYLQTSYRFSDYKYIEFVVNDNYEDWWGYLGSYYRTTNLPFYLDPVRKLNSFNVDVSSLSCLVGQYNFSYSPSAALPTSVDFSKLNSISGDVSAIKNMYDSSSKTTLDIKDGIFDLNSKIDNLNGTIESGNSASLDEIKKSNGFLGTIKDYLTITLPKSLTAIGTDVKSIPNSVATSITNAFVVEDTYFKSKFLEYEKVLKNKYPTLDLSFMKISPEPPRDYYIDIMGSKGKILNFSNTTNDSSILSFIRLVFNAIFVFLLIVFNYNQIVSLIRRSSPLVTSSSVYVDGGGKK